MSVSGAFLIPTKRGINHLWVPDTYAGDGLVLALCGPLTECNYKASTFPMRKHRLCRTCSKAIKLCLIQWFRWREWVAVDEDMDEPPFTTTDDNFIGDEDED